MSKPIKTEFFVNGFGVEMRKDTYLDAYGKEVIVTMPVNQPEPVEPEPELTETEEAILNTAINTEYLVCLAELGL